MNHYYASIPERPLTPPEDDREIVCSCAICGEDLLEGDEYYDLPKLGICCEHCVEDCHHYDLEYDY